MDAVEEGEPGDLLRSAAKEIGIDSWNSRNDNDRYGTLVIKTENLAEQEE